MPALTTKTSEDPTKKAPMTTTETATSAFPGTAAAASLLQAPGTLAAVTAAFGVVAPEIVLPVTAIIMACSAIGSYFATSAAIEATKAMSNNLKPAKTPLPAPSKVQGVDIAL